MELEFSARVHEKKVASDGVVGMIFLLATEMMFFAGLISAYIVNKAGAMAWPPPGQPRLPIAVTGVNTVVLLASGVTMWMFAAKNKRNTLSDNKVIGKNLMMLTVLLGATFLAIQGSEWAKMLHFGLTTKSSMYGAFFYTIIGAHGIHVLAGVFTLFYMMRKITTGTHPSPKSLIDSTAIYWIFVVAIWPCLYYLVYLS